MKGQRKFVTRKPMKRKCKAKRGKVKGRNHYYKGCRMASKSEVTFARACDKLKLEWEYEAIKIPWLPPPATYKPDFKFTRPDGSILYVEYKGYLRHPDKKKMAAVKKQHPELDIRIVFEDASKPVAGARVRKNGTKMTHGEWATKHGYIWAEGFMPLEWLEGEQECKDFN